MKIVVTGGCGFIGSNLVQGLNQRGIDDIIVVDDLSNGDKFVNILDCRIADYRDCELYLDELESGRCKKPDVIFHQGACSDTMQTDGQFMLRVNYDYSKRLLHYSIENGIPFIYASSASVYGSGDTFKEDPVNESALNVYAYSKLLFDRYVRTFPAFNSQVVGLRYFNVYGPREQHKGRMASVAFHFYHQMLEQNCVRLFKGSGGYNDGEQRRDFIWIGDVVDANLFFLDNSDISGLFNLGTGRAQSFNEMARAVVSSVSAEKRELSELVQSGTIKYIPIPDKLIDKYQSYTQADIAALRSIGYEKAFTPLWSGITQYVDWLKKA